MGNSQYRKKALNGLILMCHRKLWWFFSKKFAPRSFVLTKDLDEKLK